MPISIAKKWYELLKFPAKYDAQFRQLLVKYDALPPATLEGYEWGEGGKNLVMCLCFCEELERKYAEKGIPTQVLLDTLHDIVLWTDVHYGLYGELGVSETNWLKLHFSLTIFRLGRLQFAFENCRCDIPEIGIKKGEPVLDVHIPSGEVLNIEDCEQSFLEAKEFFSRYFPQYAYGCFVCHSWLLDSTLGRFMKPDSNIIRFQKMFTVIENDESLDAIRFTVNWLANKDNIATLKPHNRFTEQALKFIAEGGKFYTSFGYIKK